MKGRNARNQYSPAIQAKVSAADAEGCEITLDAEELQMLGHGPRNPVKVMRAMCVDCMAGNSAEIRRCTSVGCPLWPYRMGKNPFRVRKTRDHE